MVRRGSANEIEVLQTNGPPIGAVESVRYIEFDVQLRVGDTLLLYTDGITEAGQNRKELLGTDGLVRYFSDMPSSLDVEEAAEWIVNQAGSFGGGFRDDVCLILARRQ